MSTKVDYPILIVKGSKSRPLKINLPDHSAYFLA